MIHFWLNSGFIKLIIFFLNAPATTEIYTLSLHDALPIFKCPTLVLTGRDDIVCTPEIHVEMAHAITDASLSIIANCGHLSAMEQPETVSNALKILLNKPSRSPRTTRSGSAKLRLVKNG